jgi:hypothetical protein
MVVMGLIRKAASIMMLIGVSSHTRREPPGKAEWARAKAERAEEKAAQAQAVRAEADAKVAGEQAATLARALNEDKAHRQADLREVAEKRPRPYRSGHQAPERGMEGRPTLTHTQMPAWACTRPEAAASASAVWSRSVWSA